MKKVITLINSLHGGGAEKIAADLSFALNDAYHHEFIVTQSTQSTYEHSGKVFSLEATEAHGIINKLKRQAKIIGAIHKEKKRFKPHLTISHAAMSNIQNILSTTGEKKICVLHGEFDYKAMNGSRMINAFFRFIYSRADKIISVSKYIKEDFEKIHSIKTPHEVIYNGVNIGKIKKLALKPLDLDLGENFISYLAQLRPEKNHLRLIQNIGNCLKKMNLSLFLIGDGIQRDQIEKLIKKENLEKNVILLGSMDNPFPILSQSSLSLIASETESFSLVAVESMALGIPVISTDCGGPREIIAPEAEGKLKYPYFTSSGVIVPHINSWNNFTFADEIELMMADISLRKKMREGALERANSFDIAKTQTAYLQSISSV